MRYDLEENEENQDKKQKQSSELSIFYLPA